ncbi:MAG: TolC family protein [Steroidobacteraceae bacterium]
MNSSVASCVQRVLRRMALPVLGSAMLTACAVTPDFQQPSVPMVTQYTQSSSDATSAESASAQQIGLGQSLPVQWWTLFQSQQLNALIEQALAGNQSLLAAQASLQQAQALSEAKTGARYPQVDLQGGIGRQRYGSQFLGSITPPPPFTYFAVGPAVSYTLDYTGGVKRAIEQQQALAEFQQHQLQAAYLALTGNVVIQAMTIAATQAQIECRTRAAGR